MHSDEAFRVLGLSPETPLRDVRRRYHVLIKELHPDVIGDDSGSVSRVIEAYHCIRQGVIRSRYQETGRRSDREQDAERPLSPRTVFTLGRWSTTATDRRVRLHAVRRLAASGLQSASVFLRTAMLDTDREIASSAAEGFLACAGISAEQSILDLLGEMTVSHRLIVLAAIEQSGRVMPRVVTWASADPDRRVRDAALRLQHTGGRTA